MRESRRGNEKREGEKRIKKLGLTEGNTNERERGRGRKDGETWSLEESDRRKRAN